MLVARRRARALVARAGLRRPRRRRARAARASSPRCGRSRTRTASCCRTSARTPGRRRAGCACCAPRARSSSRSSCSRRDAEADGLGEPDLRAAGTASGGSTPEFGGGARRGARRRAAPDRRRAPPLRDGARLPGERTVAAGRARPDRPGGLTIFPTHRVARTADDASRLADRPSRRATCPAAVLYRGGTVRLLAGDGSSTPSSSTASQPSGVDLHAAARGGDRRRRPRRRGGGLPAAPDADRGRLGVRAPRRRACRRRARSSIRSSPPACSCSRLTDWLELCRAAVADVDAVLERCRRGPSASRSSARARAATTRPRSTQAAEDAIVERFRATGASIVSEEVGLLGGGRHGRRDRPDRRLAQRQARDPLLLALDRGRGGRDDGRRRLRLRPRLRLPRGVDGRAAARERGSTASRSVPCGRRTRSRSSPSRRR